MTYNRNPKIYDNAKKAARSEYINWLQKAAAVADGPIGAKYELAKLAIADEVKLSNDPSLSLDKAADLLTEAIKSMQTTNDHQLKPAIAALIRTLANKADKSNQVTYNLYDRMKSYFEAAMGEKLNADSPSAKSPTDIPPKLHGVP